MSKCVDADVSNMHMRTYIQYSHHMLLNTNTIALWGCIEYSFFCRNFIGAACFFGFIITTKPKIYLCISRCTLTGNDKITQIRILHGHWTMSASLDRLRYWQVNHTGQWIVRDQRAITLPFIQCKCVDSKNSGSITYRQKEIKLKLNSKKNGRQKNILTISKII